MKRSEADQWDWVWARSVELRHNPTAAEQAIRAEMEDLGFWFQWLIQLTGPRGKIKYEIFDFYHPELKLAVEVDGSSHRKTKGADARRDRMSNFCGIKVVRVSNKAALNGTALEQIRAADVDLA
jgi:very-short-patch-repair endonuclease